MFNLDKELIVKHSLFMGNFNISLFALDILNKLREKHKPNKNNRNKSLSAFWRYLNENEYHEGKTDFKNQKELKEFFTAKQ
jgi:hypothetical protein